MDENLNIIFNEDKTVNSVLYVAYKLSRKDFHKIFKILYFADKEHFSNYSRPITGDTYIAMQDGPVPSKLYDIFKSVRGNGYFKDNGKFSQYFKVVDWDLIEPQREPSMNLLSTTDIKFLDKAILEYGDMSWDEVRDKSHDYAWRNTVLNREISFQNILLEAGEDDSFISFVKEQNERKAIFQ